VLSSAIYYQLKTQNPKRRTRNAERKTRNYHLDRTTMLQLSFWPVSSQPSEEYRVETFSLANLNRKSRVAAELDRAVLLRQGDQS